jgi:signal transduction histidine kinase
MNRVWVRLSLIFTLVILTGVSLFWVTTSVFINNGVPLVFIREGLGAAGGMAEQLQAFYRENRSWDGVENIIQPQDLVIPRGINRPGVALLFADENGQVIYGGISGAFESERLSADDLAQAVPVIVDDVIRGYISLQEFQRSIIDGENDLPSFPLGNWLNGLLVVIVILGLLSVLAGVIASRQLVAPLTRLSDAARMFGRKNMSARVEVRGPPEIRSVATAFNEMAEDLEQAERVRRSMLADVAHELRTPITVLQANLQAILDDVYPMSKDEIISLFKQVELLQRLVNDLHLLAQAEAHQLPLSLKQVDMSALVKQALDKFEALAGAEQITLSADLPVQSIMVYADGDRLMQVLNNLIQNALTHTPGGGAVRLSLHVQEKCVVLSVKDTGSGIPVEAQAHVFDRFYRVEAARDRASGGAGLGLAIVKAIVELHRGQVSVYSSGVANAGSVFTVRLPLPETP